PSTRWCSSSAAKGPRWRWWGSTTPAPPSSIALASTTNRKRLKKSWGDTDEQSTNHRAGLHRRFHLQAGGGGLRRLGLPGRRGAPEAFAQYRAPRSPTDLRPERQPRPWRAGRPPGGTGGDGGPARQDPHGAGQADAGERPPAGLGPRGDGAGKASAPRQPDGIPDRAGG